MYTDIVGYTALSHESEALTMQLLEMHRSLVRPIFSKHNGREVKTIGDAFLVEFASALEAVRCAFDIQQSMYEMNLGRSLEKLIQLRIGVHVGDVIHSQDDVYGDAVNIASRIVPLATPGGICISRQVCDHIRNKFEFPLASLGVKELKNIAEPIEVFKVTMPWEQEEGIATSSLDPKRIAILPFVSMSPDPNDEYFADGLTEELITRVSLVKGLEVIARTSAMNYKKEKKNASQIGRELKVGTLLEGSVRKAGNRIRVSAQLINANTEGHLWAQNYDRNLEDIFEVQSSVAENVAGALKLKLLVEDRERVEATADMDAYTMYLRAMQLLRDTTETSTREAIDLFKEAISRDPTFARAYAGLSFAWIAMGPGTGWADFTTCVNQAEAAARKALELGPESAEAHTAMASVYTAMDRFEEERTELEKAIRINPNLAEANQGLGWHYDVFGRFDEAIRYYRKACSLDPLNPTPQFGVARILRMTGKVDDALEVLEGLKELHRRNPWVYIHTAECYIQNKDFAGASEALDASLRLNPDDVWTKLNQGVMYALSGRRQEALDELRDLMKNESESNRVNAQYWIRTALGDIDEAFEALNRAAELHAWFGLIKYEPLLEALRKDPRFPEFCKKVGLPP
jgi:TolB-like protein/Flp pilus assembly protein TadD